MSSNTANLRLSWDFAAVGSVDASQQWILAAMQKHGQGLVTMLWRILGNEHDVCDAYQQTFLNLAHYQDNGKCKPKNVQAFLFRTASNAAITMLRRKKRKEQSVQILGAGKATQLDVDLAHDLDVKLMQQRLRDAVAKLPEYLREVIVLHDLAGLPYQEVSKISGISAATARVYRCKAITLLASIMARESKVVK
jgi:RNA polymerase sigma factor (sigma-70 family)